MNNAEIIIFHNTKKQYFIKQENLLLKVARGGAPGPDLYSL